MTATTIWSIVGALHLVGKDSVIELLEKGGHKDQASLSEPRMLDSGSVSDQVPALAGGQTWSLVPITKPSQIATRHSATDRHDVPDGQQRACRHAPVAAFAG